MKVMWRVCLLLIVALSTAVLARAELNPADTTRVHMQDCLDLRIDPGVAADGGASGLSLRGLAATLGIGLLSMLFLLPVALVCDWLMRRDRAADAARTAWE